MILNLLQGEVLRDLKNYGLATQGRTALGKWVSA